MTDVRETYGTIFAQIADWGAATEIADMTATEITGITPADMAYDAEELCTLCKKFGLEMRVVFVAPDDGVFALMRVFATHASFKSAHCLNVVRNRQEAAEWLEISLPRMEEKIDAL
ncbi:hypothetical protein [Candidatus Rhodobacter oscarellae]|nr:hypothetical protein [Candidatus Rhodobacter lobularis]